MAAISGEFKISGISDEDVSTIFKLKAKHPGLFFDPQGMLAQSPGARVEQRQVRLPSGVMSVQQVQVPVNGGRQTYSNCSFSWNTEDGLRAAYTVLHKMVHGHESEPSFPVAANAA